MTIAVVGGSGLYESGAVSVVAEHRLTTPWGGTSAPIVESQIGSRRVLFLPRHGRGHIVGPSWVPYRANVAALKKLGAKAILSISACGSLREEMGPGDVVMPDQFIDRTRHRVDSYFGQGVVAHVSLADPFCDKFSAAAASIIPQGIRVHRGGTYLAMEGPQFSTRAESHWYRSMGASIIGMTNLTEARLAREAELCYASMSFVTDYDCWKEEHVTVDEVLRVLHRNADVSKSIIAAISALPDWSGCHCGSALQYALVTAPPARDPSAVRMLEYLNPSVKL